MSMLTDIKRNTATLSLLRVQKLQAGSVDTGASKAVVSADGTAVELLSTGSRNARINRLVYQYQLTTANATPATLYSRTVYSMTASSNALNIVVTCLNTATGDSSCFILRGVLSRLGAALPVLQGVTKTIMRFDSGLDANLSIDGATNNVVLTVTGLAATSLLWQATVEDQVYMLSTPTPTLPDSTIAALFP